MLALGIVAGTRDTRCPSRMHLLVPVACTPSAGGRTPSAGGRPLLPGVPPQPGTGPGPAGRSCWRGAAPASFPEGSRTSLPAALVLSFGGRAPAHRRCLPALRLVSVIAKGRRRAVPKSVERRVATRRDALGGCRRDFPFGAIPRGRGTERSHASCARSGRQQCNAKYPPGAFSWDEEGMRRTADYERSPCIADTAAPSTSHLLGANSGPRAAAWGPLQRRQQQQPPKQQRRQQPPPLTAALPAIHRQAGVGRRATAARCHAGEARATPWACR